MTISSGADDVQVRGRVADAMGAAISRAQILIVDPTGSEKKIKTDSSGSFETMVSDKFHSIIVVTSPGFRPFCREMKPNKKQQVSFKITLQVEPLDGKCSGGICL